MVVRPSARAVACLSRTSHLLGTLTSPAPVSLRASGSFLRSAGVISRPSLYPRFVSTSSKDPPPTSLPAAADVDPEPKQTPALHDAAEADAAQLQNTPAAARDAVNAETSASAGGDGGPEQGGQEGESSEVPAASSTWYLDVEPPRHPMLVPSPIKLPDTPEGSHKIVEPLIKFVGDDLGLDNLELLDLREVDPPPALGPNLMMLFGTARSERHMHVSADRLVRWLRTHGINADADGLLGRNELKIKLRRAARKARLLGETPGQSAGADGRRDDGISTGWICVNMGTLDAKVKEVETFDEEGRSAGFGTHVDGSTLVVQVMTQERREELALERLWGGILKKCLKEKEALAEAAKQAELEPPKKAPHPYRKPGWTSDKARASYIKQQTRQMSTASHSSHRAGAAWLHDYMARDADKASVAAAAAPAAAPAAANKHMVQNVFGQLLYIPRDKLRLMEQLKFRLSQMNPRAAAGCLDFTAFGSKRSPFLEMCDMAVANMPPTETWSFRVFLATAAMALCVHPAIAPRISYARFSMENARVSKQKGPETEEEDQRFFPLVHLHATALERLVELVEELHVSGAPLNRSDAVVILEALFSGADSPEIPLQRRLDLATVVVETMHQRGQTVLANDVLLALTRGLGSIQHISRKRRNWRPAFDEARTEARRVLDAIDHVRAHARLPCPSDPEIMTMMERCARANDWPGFWAAWSLPARYHRRRSAEMYRFLFRLVASLPRPLARARAVETLRRCIPEAHRELPRVHIVGPLAVLARRLVAMADPGAPALEKRVFRMRKSWHRAYRSKLPTILGSPARVRYLKGRLRRRRFRGWRTGSVREFRRVLRTLWKMKLPRRMKAKKSRAPRLRRMMAKKAQSLRRRRQMKAKQTQE